MGQNLDTDIKLKFSSNLNNCDGFIKQVNRNNFD